MIAVEKSMNPGFRELFSTWARSGQQCSLVSSFQHLTVAMARSPTARILAWLRLTAFSRRDKRGRRAVAFERGADTAAGALVALVGEGHHLLGGERLDHALLAG